jgi:hypothetical protein
MITEYTAALDAFLAENDEEEDVTGASSAANGTRLAMPTLFCYSCQSTPVTSVCDVRVRVRGCFCRFHSRCCN